MACPGNQHCANCIGTVSFPISPRESPQNYIFTNFLSTLLARMTVAPLVALKYEYVIYFRFSS